MRAPEWEVAGGSVRGTRHRHADTANQDAFHWEASGRVSVALVTDGCSSGSHSEVGARLGARLLARAFLAECAGRTGAAPWQPGSGAAEFLARVQSRLLASFLGVAGAMGGPSRELLDDWFLFAAVAALRTPQRTLVACFGDGVAALNGELRVVASEGNRPRYPLYGLLREPEPEAAFPGETLWDVPTAEVGTILLGTDGAADLAAAEARTLPGSAEPVGPLAQFWSDDRYFRNPDRLRRRLALANRDRQHVDWETGRVQRDAGLLPDDTTLVVLRRAPGPVREAEEGGP